MPLVTTADDGSVKSVKLPRPSNPHGHVRDGALREAVTPWVLANTKHLIVMPNVDPPLKTVEASLTYLGEVERIRDRLGLGTNVLGTLYNHDGITPKMIEQMAATKRIVSIKCYPAKAGMTTGSGQGIPLEQTSDDVLRAAIDNNIVYQVHGEVDTMKDGTPLEPAMRERYYMTDVLPYVRDAHPDLRISVEHGTTVQAVRLVDGDPSGKTVMTITPQHLLFVEDDFMQPWGNDLKCMPILKWPTDRAALIKAATSGDRRFFAGTDTAPHPSRKKRGDFQLAANGCWLPHWISLYTQAFHAAGKLDSAFDDFMSYSFADWMGLPRPEPDDTVLVTCDTAHDIPAPINIEGEDDVVIPLGWTETGNRLSVGFSVRADF